MSDLLHLSALMFGSYSVGAEAGRGAGFWPPPHPLSLWWGPFLRRPDGSSPRSF